MGYLASDVAPSQKLRQKTSQSAATLLVMVVSQLNPGLHEQGLRSLLPFVPYTSAGVKAKGHLRLSCNGALGSTAHCDGRGKISHLSLALFLLLAVILPTWELLN
jgi:hypothetical protein